MTCPRGLIAAVFVVTVGCSSDEVAKGTVTGEVTLDGQPLKTGLIRFVPADGKTPTADATITDGKFSAVVPLGEKKVEINAPKVVGKLKMYDTPDSPVVEQTKDMIPQQYNVRSTLTLTVQKGSQEKKFELKSR
jgi:hypothetical protein